MNKTIDWNAIAADYPVNNNYIWLNNAGYVPPGNHILKTINTFIKTIADQGMTGHNFVFPVLHKNIKSILSGLFGCSEDDIALIHNTAEGINFISHGLILKEDDEVLLLDQEYPSNIYPWEHLKDKGITLSFIPNAYTPDEFIQNFKTSITPHTKAAALSAVHWCTGMPFPLKELAGICTDMNIDLVLDVSQGAGHVPVHIDDWHLSFCTGSAWKWLQGPLGLGILIIKKEKIPSLTHIFKGTSSVVSHKNYLPYKEELLPTVDRYVYSTPSLIDWAYFDASLAYLSQIGFDNICNRIFALSEYLCDGLADKGFSVLNHRYAPVQSGIVVAEHKTVNSTQIVQQLNARNIITADRYGRVRFSLHICNTLEQIDRVLTEMERIVG